MTAKCLTLSNILCRLVFHTRFAKGKKARLLDSNVLAVLPSSIEGLLANFLAISTLQEASVSAQ